MCPVFKVSTLRFVENSSLSQKKTLQRISFQNTAIKFQTQDNRHRIRLFNDFSEMIGCMVKSRDKGMCV